MKSKKIAAIVAGASMVAGVVLVNPGMVAHAESLHKTQEHYTLANSGLQLQAVNIKTGKVLPTTDTQKKDAAQSFAVTFHGYSHSTRYNGYPLHQLKKQAYFHSALQERLYNYLLNPNNRWKVEKNAIELHGGDRGNNCAYWVSTALNWIGADIPYTSYCGTLRDELANNGWARMTDFSQLRAGDVCFAGDAHTYIFMGWANQADSIAWVADSQYGWFGNNVHVRSTWEDGDISATTDFWGAPGADAYNPNVNTNSNTNPDYNSYNVGVTNCDANVRSGPSTSDSIIGNYSYGSYVQITNESGNWWQVNYNGQVGYVYKSLVNGNGPVHYNSVTVTNPTPAPAPAPKVYTSKQYPKIGTGTINQYTWSMPNPNWTGGCVETWDSGNTVTITGYSNGWYRVNYQDGSVWIPASRVNTDLQGKQYKTIVTGVANYLYGNDVTVSTSPSGSVLGLISNGAPVKITGEKGDWYRIDYGQTSGWVPKNSLDNPNNYPATPISKTGIVNKENTAKNIPNEYGFFNYNIASGTKVKITGEWQDWYQINNNGKTEWIPKSDITFPVQHKTIGKGMVEFPSYGGSCVMTESSWDGNIVTLAKDNTEVNIIGEQNGWFEITLPDGSTGWLPRTRVVTNVNNNIMLGDGATNMYTDIQSGPNWESNTISTVPAGTLMNIKSEKDGWYEVYYGNYGATGWIEGNRINTTLNTNKKVIENGVISLIGVPSMDGLTYTSLSYGPSWNCDYAGTLNNGTKIQIVGEANGWYQINYGKSTAWVLKCRVAVGNQSTTASSDVKTVNFGLGYSYLMSGPSWDDNFVCSLNNGTKVTVLETSSNWSKVQFNGNETAWILTDRLK